MALTAMPPSFLRATLQHGHECVGFLHNRAHVAAHGENAVFAADVVCAWSEGSALPSLAPSQRAKLLVTGPPTLLQKADHGEGDTDGEADDAYGLVCENLHSPRLNASSNHCTAFPDAFETFSAALAKEGHRLVLRPHPSGRYVLENGVPISGNVTCETRPIYRMDLSRHAYGISAPSTVLVDMMLAGIAVAVWRDPVGAWTPRIIAVFPQSRRLTNGSLSTRRLKRGASA